MLGIARKQTGAVAAAAARRAAALAPKGARAMHSEMDTYGSQCFVGAVADKVCDELSSSWLTRA